MRAIGNHHVRFTPAMWYRWLKRLNAPVNMQLREGIQEFRSRVATYEARNRS